MKYIEAPSVGGKGASKNKKKKKKGDGPGNETIQLTKKELLMEME